MAAVTIHSDFGAKKRKSVTTSTFSPSTCHEVMGLHAMILVFLICSFKLALSLSSSTLIKRLFSSSLLSPGVGNGNPLQYSCLENPMDRGLVGYSLWGCKESDTTEDTTEHTRMCPGQGGTDALPHLSVFFSIVRGLSITVTFHNVLLCHHLYLLFFYFPFYWPLLFISAVSCLNGTYCVLPFLVSWGASLGN